MTLYGITSEVPYKGIGSMKQGNPRQGNGMPKNSGKRPEDSHRKVSERELETNINMKYDLPWHGVLLSDYPLLYNQIRTVY